MQFDYKKIIKIFEPWFYIDTRSLGIFRIFLGVLCLFDILRRWDYIDIFYTNNGIIASSASGSYYKMFNLLTTFTTSWEVHLFFLAGIIFSIFLIIGYKTKLSHIICAIVIISIHNRAIILENASDMFMNSILVWTAFLPLGISYSLDSLKKNLTIFKDYNISSLNDRTNNSKPRKIFSIAYFAVLYQISAIYFFTALNKSGYDWSNGSAVYKMFELDTFLSTVGYVVRDFITPTVSKFLTYSTITLEYLVPILIFIPFYNYIFRFFLVIALTVFHISIRLFIKVGLFSQTMIITYVLLIDTKVYDFVNRLIEKYWIKNKKYILFYDSDCGFCHYTVRIIKRLDLYSIITFADSTYKGDKPLNYNELSSQTAMLYDEDSKNCWVKHEAFGKVLSLLPFGFIVSWIFFIPGISLIFEKTYDFIAKNRTRISQFFGQPACGIDSRDKAKNIITEIDTPPYRLKINLILKFISSCFVVILIFATLNYNLVANESVNKNMSKMGYDKFKYNKFLKRIAYYPRMVQRWNMFSPTVLKTDRTVVVSATLYDNSTIDIFTGKPPVLDSVDYENLWHGHDQFWRKFFSRLSKKNNKKYIRPFEKWIKRNTNTYFDSTLKGNKIKSVNIWSISQKNPDMGSSRQYKVYKQLLNKTAKKK